MRVVAVDHVAVNVEDVAAAIAFYTDVLGLSLRDDRPDLGFAGAWLDAGDQQVHLMEAPPAPAVGQHLSVLVEDVDGAVAELRTRGVAVGDPVAVGADRQAFLADPSGNTIELHERGAR